MNSTLKSTILFLLLCIALNKLIAVPNDIKLNQLSIDEGLSNPTIFSIIQDHKDAMWMATLDGLNRFDGYSFRVYRNERNNPKSIKTGEPTSLFIDSDRQLWIGGSGWISLYNFEKDNFDNFEINIFKGKRIKINAINEIDKHLVIGTNNGILLFEKQKKQFQYLNSNFASNTAVYSICVQNDNVYFGTQNGLYAYNLIKKSFRLVSNELKGKVVLSVLSEGDSKIWLGTEGDGLYLYDLKSNELRNFKNNPHVNTSICSNFIRSIAFDSQGNLWVGTFNGLCILEPGSNVFTRYFHTTYDDKSISQNSVRAIYMDSQGGVWLGTYYGGLNYYHPLKNRFEHITQKPYCSFLNDRIICPIAEDNSGNIWIGTNDNGINKYNPHNGLYLYINMQNNSTLKSNNIKSFLLTKHGLLVGTHAGGLYNLNIDTNVLTQITSSKCDISNEGVYSLEYDNDKNILIGTLNGLYKYNESTQELSKVTYIDTKESFIYAVKWDSKNRLWLGTEKSVILYDSHSKKTIFFSSNQYNGTDNIGIVNSIFEDTNKTIWICSNAGLSKYLGHGKFITYTTDDGLASNIVFGVVEDTFGRLWITTNNGLSCYNYRNSTFRNYYKIDGLPFNQFNNYSFCQTKEGKLYLGGLNGIATFYPELLFDNPFTPKAFISKIRLFDKIVTPDDETGILKRNITEADEITLSPFQTNFSIELGVSNYLSGGHNTFAYKLQGADKNWLYTIDNRVISYSNLPYGRYVFRVKVANNDGKWNNEERRLTIIIEPHWWQTWWAICMYILIIVVISHQILKFLRQRREMDFQLRQERLEKEKNEEINQMKMNFFINISHEFKTPLTLILSPLQDVIEKVTDKWQKSQLVNIQNNASKLLHLVNQLMDYRRAELGVFELNVARMSPLHKVEEVFNLFEKVAKQRSIDFKFENQLSNEVFIIDENYLDLILTNLLSNAFKFTPGGGRVFVQLCAEVNGFLLKVEDTGCGIAKDKLDLIFDRFYQVNTDQIGSGIGLSLVKKLVDLHFGNITVESEFGKGTVFTVYFPQNEELFTCLKETEDEAQEARSYIGKNLDFLNNVEDVEDGNEKKDVNLERILVVEDNEDVLCYLKSKFAAQFEVVTAHNGLEALDVVEKCDVDLILTDVMMAEMDGVKLCKVLKQNIRTCHIPIIMLSAKSNIEDQLKGLEVGADDYVAKPFTYAILSKKITNMLKSRKRSLEYYAHSKEIQPEKITFNAMDELLLKKALEIVNKNIDNIDFTADTFCSEMCMSRSNLHIKLKAITGESTIDFIKKVRFNKACELLLDGRYSVADISTMVGFNSPSYFTTSFKKYFGFLPSEYPQKGAFPQN